MNHGSWDIQIHISIFPPSVYYSFKCLSSPETFRITSGDGYLFFLHPFLVHFLLLQCPVLFKKMLRKFCDSYTTSQLFPSVPYLHTSSPVVYICLSFKTFQNSWDIIISIAFGIILHVFNLSTPYNKLCSASRLSFPIWNVFKVYGTFI